MSANRLGSTHVNVDLSNLTPRELVRLQRLARELRLTDQILSIDLDTLTVEANGPAPAWTTLTGDEVSFNMAKMPKPHSKVDVAVWLGTNAHELGHVLFSPRAGSTIMFRVLESDRTFLPGIAQMHNIVEDQRQERLVLARFAPWRGYLTAALGHHLVADDNSAWLLMAGRTWLPDDIRSVAKARFVAHRSQAEADEVSRLVGEYQRLTDPGESDADEAWEILQALHAMFEDEQPKGGGGCGGGIIRDGAPSTDEPGEGAPVPADADEADPDAEPAEGEDEGEGDGEAEAKAKGDKLKGEAKGSGKQPKAETGDNDAGSGSGAGNQPGAKPFDARDVRKDLKDAAKGQIEADEQASEELDSVLDAMDHGRAGEDAEGERPLGRWVPADDQARRLHREVSDALLDLKDETEPGWLKRVDSGRLNVRRYATSDFDPDQLFDRYEPGMMDASELEVVLLLDVSGSMAGQLSALGRAAWAIRMAVDDLEGVCTVITYESGPHRLLAEPGQRPDDRMFIPSAMGGTQPKSALLESLRVLAGSPAKNRLLIILTDGEWWGDQADEVIKALGAEGVTTVMAFLGARPRHYVNGTFRESDFDLHECQYGAHIDDPDELARLFRRIATERIRSWR